jgi:hypothetical protein
MWITIQVLGIGAGAEHPIGLSRWVVQPDVESATAGSKEA